MIKKLLPVILSVVALTAFAQSPITIDVTDMVQIGDEVPRKSDTMTVITGPGPAGANQAWTMTSISSNPAYILDETTSVVTVGSTPYSSQFSSSNIALTNDDISYVYMNQNASTLTTQGGAGDLLMTGSIIVAPLNPDLKLHNFPRTYQSSFTDTYATDVTIDGSDFSVYQVRYKRVGTMKDTTDGWGTLTTPAGTYNTIRVKHTDYSRDTIWYKLLSFTPWTVLSNKIDTTYSYQWLGNDMKLAVAELNYDSLDQPKTFKWTLIPPLSVGVNEQMELKAETFPNPAADQVNLRLGNEIEAGEYFFCLYDVTGKMLLQEKINGSASATYTFSVNDLATGLYTWQLSDRMQVRKGSGKLNIVR